MRGLALAPEAAHGTNYAAIIISVGIIFIVGAVIAMVVASYFRLQGHRADAVAMAGYRKLAEQAVANQQELRDQTAKLTEHVRGRAADAGGRLTMVTDGRPNGSRYPPGSGANGRAAGSGAADGPPAPPRCGR